jgi:hypothetical protein
MNTGRVDGTVCVGGVELEGVDVSMPSDPLYQVGVSIRETEVKYMRAGRRRVDSAWLEGLVDGSGYGDAALILCRPTAAAVQRKGV